MIVYFLIEYLIYFSVVEFATHSDLRNALDKLDNTELNGRRIRLVEDRRRGGRHSRSSSSRSRSRSRRRSRSRSRFLITTLIFCCFFFAINVFF